MGAVFIHCVSQGEGKWAPGVVQHPQRAQFSPKSAAPIGISSLQEGFTPSKPV